VGVPLGRLVLSDVREYRKAGRLGQRSDLGVGGHDRKLLVALFRLTLEELEIDP